MGSSTVELAVTDIRTADVGAGGSFKSNHLPLCDENQVRAKNGVSGCAISGLSEPTTGHSALKCRLSRPGIYRSCMAGMRTSLTMALLRTTGTTETAVKTIVDQASKLATYCQHLGSQIPSYLIFGMLMTMYFPISWWVYRLSTEESAFTARSCSSWVAIHITTTPFFFFVQRRTQYSWYRLTINYHNYTFCIFVWLHVADTSLAIMWASTNKGGRPPMFVFWRVARISNISECVHW